MTSKRQREIFSQNEGNEWFERNEQALQKKEAHWQSDIIQTTIKNYDLPIDQNSKILEVGCSNGWRLNCLNKQYGSDCYGVEPSKGAVERGQGQFPDISLIQGTADSLPFENHTFDFVILGFFLYLVDREDLFKIAHEVDRVLKPKSFLCIHDFFTETPKKNAYAHVEDVSSYKMDYSKMFSWAPSYNVIHKSVVSHSSGGLTDDFNEQMSIFLLRKNVETSYASQVVF